MESLALMYNNYTPREPSFPGYSSVLVLGMEFITEECYETVRQLSCPVRVRVLLSCC
jgi:hypothetical protein